jgi:hypothetical protein
MKAREGTFSSPIQTLSALLTPRRIRTHALILALCLWGVCAVDYARPRLFDRGGNVRFHDFLPLYVSAQMIEQHHAFELYDPAAVVHDVQTIVHRPSLHVPNLYGPQVSLFFVPLTRVSFLSAATVWVTLSLLIYFVCIHVLWRCCPGLQANRRIVVLCAIAYPPLFHFFVRGQLSALILLCFTAAFLALRANRHFLAGMALGVLVFKPQFLVAIPLILFLARAWNMLAALILSSVAQLVFARLYFGPAVMRGYFEMLRSAPRWIGNAELSLAPIQMHSLRSFWALLLPWPMAATSLYLVSSIAVIALATTIWRSAAPLAFRFSALLLAAILANPHLFIYDLLALIPMFLLLADWSIENVRDPEIPTLRVLLYLAFLLPLFGPLARWTHFQLSVVVFAALLWTLHQTTRSSVSLED